MYIRLIKTKLSYFPGWWNEWKRPFIVNERRWWLVRRQIFHTTKLANAMIITVGPFSIMFPWFMNPVFKAYKKPEKLDA